MTPAHAFIPFALALAIGLSGCDGLAQHTAQEHIQRAKDFEDRGNLRGSIVELKNAIQKSPDNAQARLLLGQAYLKIGKGLEAEKELRQAEKHGVALESIKPLLGEALLLAGEYRRVLQEVLPSEKTTPQNLARIQHMRAEAMFNMGTVAEACALFRQSLELDATNPEAHWGLAQCALADGDHAQARAWLDSAIKTKRRQAQTWVYLGNLAQQTHQPESAVTAYTQALGIEADQTNALQYRAALYLALGRIDAARRDIEHLGKIQPRSSTTLYLRALLDFEEKRFVPAQEKIQQVLKEFPDYMPAILLAGATEYSLGAYEQAESLLKRYKAKFPGHRYATRMLAATQIRRGQPKDGLATLVPLLVANPDDVQTLVLAAEALRLGGEADKSTEYLQRAAELAPKDAAIQTELGLSLLSAGKREAAIAELDKAVSAGSGQVRADLLMILTFLDLKQYDKAIATIRATGAKLPNNPLLSTMLGSAQLGQGDTAAARTAFEQALALDPAFFPAAASLARLDLAEKKPDAARKRFERILERDASHLQSMLALAELATAAKQDRVAADWLEKAAKAHPRAIAPRAILVRRHIVRGEFQQALAVADEAVAANPDNAAALDLLGAAQLAGRDALGAASTYGKLVQRPDASVDTLQRLARAQIAAGKPATARATLEQALKRVPGHVSSLDTLVRLEMREGRTDQALTAARQIQTLHPGLALGFEREGDILLHLKRPEPAAAAFEKAQHLQPQTAQLVKLHRALVLAGKNRQADPRLDDWIAHHPADLQARGYRAEYLLAQGRSQEATAAYEALLAEAPDNTTVLNNLANLYLGANDAARARSMAEKALRLAPDNPAFQDTLGWILLQQGQAERGLELLGKALASLPRNPDVRYRHALALARVGDKARARQEFESLLREPGQPPLRVEAIRRELRALRP